MNNVQDNIFRNREYMNKIEFKEYENTLIKIAKETKDLFNLNYSLNKQERINSIICLSLPPTYQFEITNKCNLGCIQCGVIRRGEVSTLPFSVFEKLWNTFYFTQGIAWLGGEVFLVEYFLDLLNMISSNFPHINHTLYTNGIMIDEKIASVLVNINNLQLKFSIDSIVKETYEYLRSKGKFDILLKNIKLLRETYKSRNKMPNFGVNVIVMKSNLQQISSYPDFCMEYGIKTLDVSFLADVNPPHLVEENIFYNADENLLKKVKDIIKIVELKCKKYGIKLFCNFDSYVDLDNGILKSDVDRRRSETYGITRENINQKIEYKSRCFWPWHSMYIKCNGKVVPTGDCPIPIGNILEDSINNIWNSPIMQVYRYKLLHSDLSNWCAYHCQQRFEVNKKLLTIT